MGIDWYGAIGIGWLVEDLPKNLIDQEKAREIYPDADYPKDVASNMLYEGKWRSKYPILYLSVYENKFGFGIELLQSEDWSYTIFELEELQNKVTEAREILESGEFYPWLSDEFKQFIKDNPPELLLYVKGW